MWTQGSTAYGLPDGYSMSGTLRTTDKEAGYYGMYLYTILTMQNLILQWLGN